MFGAGLVDVLQQRRQGGGFARTGGSGHQQQAPGFAPHGFHHRGHAQAVEGGNAVAQGPQAGGVGAPLAVHVDPKAGDPLEPIGAVQFPGLLQLLALGVVQQGKDQPVALLLIEHLLPDGPQVAAEAAVGRLTGCEVEVAAATLHQLLHQVFDLELHRASSAGGSAPFNVNSELLT